MTGVVFDVKKFAVHDGPGIRTTIFLKGCPLKCTWCHNPEGISSAVQCVPRIQRVGDFSFVEMEQIGREVTVEGLMEEILSDSVFMEESGGGVTFSGGEPFMQFEFLLAIIYRCREAGIHVVVDTSAYTKPDMLLKATEVTNLFLVDLKMMDDDLHRRYTGVSNKRILENLRQLSEKKKQFRIRIPVIPEISLAKDNINRVIQFLKQLPEPPVGVDLLPFHNSGSHKYERLELPNAFRGVKSMRAEDLEEVSVQFQEAGIAVCVGF